MLGRTVDAFVTKHLQGTLHFLGEHRLKLNHAATTEQRERAGKGESDNFPPKKTPEGLCPWWTSYQDLGEMLLCALCDGDGGMKCCLRAPGYPGLVVKDR